MSAEKIKGVLTFICDACGDFQEFERTVTFESAWAELKEKGIAAVARRRSWGHLQ